MQYGFNVAYFAVVGTRTEPKFVEIPQAKMAIMPCNVIEQ